MADGEKPLDPTELNNVEQSDAGSKAAADKFLKEVSPVPGSREVSEGQIGATADSNVLNAGLADYSKFATAVKNTDKSLLGVDLATSVTNVIDKLNTLSTALSRTPEDPEVQKAVRAANESLAYYSKNTTLGDYLGLNRQNT